MKKETLTWSLLLVLLTACAPERGEIINKLKYTRTEIIQIKSELMFLNNIADSLSRDIFPEFGFLIANDSVFYRHCIDKKGNYIDSHSCNLDSVLSSSDRKKMDDLILDLKKKQISASSYSLSLQEIILILDTDYQQYGDGRYLYATTDSTALLSSGYEILDHKYGLYLLKDKK